MRSTASCLIVALGVAVSSVAAAPRPAAASSGAAADEPVVRINGSGSALDLMTPLLRAYAAAHPSARFEVKPPLGSSGAVKGLLAGALDLAVVSRDVDAAEVAQGARARAYGRTPLRIVAHASVAKLGVTLAELEDIFAGRTASWPDGERIRVVLRPEKETETRLLVGLSPGMAQAYATARRHPWAVVAVTDHDAREMIARTPGAIGAVTLTSLLVASPSLRSLALDGVEGTPRALADGRYRLSKDVVFVTSPRTPPAAQAIVDFAFTAAGRAVAEAAGVLITAPAGAR